MRRPTLALAVAVNRAVRAEDEWFDEPDDLDRVQRALSALEGIEDPVRGAAVVAARVTRAQGFAEGNKRTALVLARWVLDRNGIDGAAVLPPQDREVANLLLSAARGEDVEARLVRILTARRR